jgi:ABC-type transporter Mla subunit MlaD
MADVKREVRSLGQTITGLKAGDNVTLVLKKPKPKVDASAAKKAANLAEQHIENAREAIQSLTRAHSIAAQNPAEAQKLLTRAKQVLDAVRAQVPRAKDWAKTAADDHGSAPSEVKDGYGAAKDGADLAAGHLEKVAEGLEKAVLAVGAFIEEVSSRG